MKKIKLTWPSWQTIANVFDAIMDICCVSYLIWYDWHIGLPVIILVYGTRLRMALMFKEHLEKSKSITLPFLSNETLLSIAQEDKPKEYTMADLDSDAVKALTTLYKHYSKAEGDAFLAGFKEGSFHGYNRAEQLQQTKKDTGPADGMGRIIFDHDQPHIYKDQYLTDWEKDLFNAGVNWQAGLKVKDHGN